MAENFKVSVAPAVDAAAAEAAGGGGAGGGGAGGPEFFSSGGLLRGAGAPLPSFTVVAADMKNSTFKVIRPYVYVTGYGEVSVSSATFGFGATVYCVVTRKKQKSGGYTYTAKLASKEDDAFACVKVAEIPAVTSMFACGGVMQFHSGAIIIAAPSDSSLVTKDITMVTRLKDASTSDSTLKMKYFTKTVSVVVPEASGSDGDESEPSESSESVTIAHFYEQKYVTGVVYDPLGHELYYKFREEKQVVVDARSGEDSESNKVFTAEPVCGD